MTDTSNEQESKAERAEAVSRMLNDEETPITEAPNPDGGSDPATGTGTVGESVTRRGEDMVSTDGKEAGRSDVSDSPSGRPAGTSDARDATGVNPSDPVTDSPPQGGQGG